jgi:hypothetical protein
MKFLRHVGTLRDTGHRVIVVFRKLPDEPQSCLVVETDSLPDRFHQNLMDAVESLTAQETLEFFEYANRQFFYDGSNMLSTLHNKGFLRKIPTERVIMRPRIDVEINLSELNRSLDQLSSGVDPATIQPGDGPVANHDDGVIDDATLAQNLRKQAELFEKQATELRAQADSIDPKAAKTRSKKKSAAVA